MPLKRCLIVVLLVFGETVRKSVENSCEIAGRLEISQGQINVELEEISERVKRLLALSHQRSDDKQYVQTEDKERYLDQLEDGSRRFLEIQEQAEQLITEAKANQDKLFALIRRKDENQRKIQIIREKLKRLHGVCSEEEVMKCPSDIIGEDCSDVFDKGGRRSGIYFIQPSRNFTPFPAYCDQETDGGGWTYIHSHINDDFDFNRSWLSYKHGFGDVSCDGKSNFWIGNEALHVMTSLRNYHLRADVMDWSDNEGYASYSSFHVEPEEMDYQLRISGYEAAEDPDMRIGDAFKGHNFGYPDDESSTKHDGMKFSTFDRDNDRYQYNCASQDGGGWWFNRCSAVNLNGRVYRNGFYKAANTLYGFDNGMIWGPWTGLWYALKSSSMRIRPAFLNNEK
uniref:fibrinogen-like protein 1 n=1 Tax=Styela clava TaxID=7725 RepID=UPI00193A0982|nr:fibrinogen-like protein 1 [Styela clava]